MKTMTRLLLIVAATMSLHQSAVADETPAASSDSKPSRKTRMDWAEIELTGTYPESNAMPGLFGDLVGHKGGTKGAGHKGVRNRLLTRGRQ